MKKIVFYKDHCKTPMGSRYSAFLRDRTPLRPSMINQFDLPSLMNSSLLFLKIAVVTFFLFALEAQAESTSGKTIEKPLYQPLIERYILDELKDIRSDGQKLRVEVERRLSKAEVEQTDRAARYVTDTVGNIFYLIAAATSLLIFAGWNSLRDIRRKTEDIIELRVEQITKKYNAEMDLVQAGLQEQSIKILENQKKIYNTQLIHSLWMRANLETSLQSKIDIYDEIIKHHPDDAEAYAYKADAVLDLDEFEWALNLSNNAIDIDNDYGYAYWQRACANAELGNINDAISDLKMALLKAPNLRDEVVNEKSFDRINETKEFKDILERV